MLVHVALLFCTTAGVDVEQLVKIKSSRLQATDDKYSYNETDFASALASYSHSQPRNGCIVYECTSYCGGIGDRLKGITQLFLLSMYLGCDFKVYWPSVRKFWALHPTYEYKERVHQPANDHVRIYAIDRQLNVNKVRRHLQMNRTLIIRTNGRPLDWLPGSLGLTNPHWIYIGHVWHHLYSLTAYFKSLIDSDQQCDSCVHARIGDNWIGRSMVYDQRFHDKVTCAAQLARNCVYIASDNDNFKKMYKSVPFVRMGDEKVRHSDKSSAIVFSLKELHILSKCNTLVCGGSGFALAARSIGRIANPRMTTWHATCVNKKEGL